MTPYYDEGGITIYHGDCREVLPELAGVDAIVTDPPYGISAVEMSGGSSRSVLTRSRDYAPIVGDSAPFDPAHLLSYPKVVLFGANHYADRLPPSAAWLVWDKLDGLRTDKRVIGFNDQADCELAWTNFGGPARLVPIRWMGLMKGSERTESRLHPTQKPVALFTAILSAWVTSDELTCDPYLGSGSTLRAAKDLGRKAIGIEIEERYCEIAANRLGQEVLDFGGAA